MLRQAEEAAYPQGSFKGQCKLEDKHAGSWGLSQAGAGGYDGRASFFIDSVLPHSGRHSGRVWVPSAAPVPFGVPGLTTNLQGVPILNDTSYSVELWARSFPPGMSIEVSAGTWTSEALVPRSPLGLAERSVYASYEPSLGVHKLGANWSKITAVIPNATRLPKPSAGPMGLAKAPTINLVARAAAEGEGVFPAGSVWVDDVAVTCVSGCPPSDAVGAQ